jgi:hypothetical protein
MEIANIKYGAIVDMVKQWIKSNCKNITDYNSIENVFKSGYTKTEKTYKGSSKSVSIKSTLNTTPVKQVLASVVDTNMTDFCKKYQLNDKLEKYISEDELFHFIQNMITFISCKCVFVTSQFSTKVYLIYDDSNDIQEKQYNGEVFNVFNITSDKQLRLIYDEDVGYLVLTMIEVAKNHMRHESCKYTWTIS